MIRRSVHTALVLATVVACVSSAAGQATDAVTGVLKHAGITEHIGETIDLDATFLDESGNPIIVRDYFDGEHPVVLTFVYHTCPMLCSMVLDGLSKSMAGIEWDLGAEYRAVSVSIDPNDSPELAARQKERYLSRLGSESHSAGWAFLTGQEDQIASLAASAGFDFEKDPETGEYGHAATVILVSPEGEITRYLYGISYTPFDLRASLIEASEGKVGGIADRFIMFCFHYDPMEGSYVPHAWLAMRLAGGLTLVLLVGLLAVLWKREHTSQSEDTEEKELEGSDE